MVDAREESNWKYVSYLAYYSATAFGGGKKLEVDDFNPYKAALKKQQLNKQK